MHTTSIGEAIGQIQAVLNARNSESAQHPVDSADTLAALTALRQLREELADWEPQLIAAAREQGASWGELAVALGVTSRQAAERRYLRLRPSDNGERTGEGRVQAERTKRAGDRAVAAWARQNSGVLRQLAGQISALQGLSRLAQQQVDLVSLALADDDVSSLLAPLTDAYAHLQATHAGLANRIGLVIDEAEQLRQRTHAQRAKSRKDIS